MNIVNAIVNRLRTNRNACTAFTLEVRGDELQIFDTAAQAEHARQTLPVIKRESAIIRDIDGYELSR